MAPGRRLLRFAAALSLALTLTLPDETPAAPKSGTKPSVSAPSPAKGTVTVSATSSPGGLNRLEIHVDGKFLVSCPETPCDYPWNSRATTDGPHTLVAKRYGNNGSITSSEPVSVVVANASPAVSVNAPSTAAGLVTISVSATDANGVTQTQLYIDAALIRTTTGGSLTYQWDTTMYPDGTHAVQAAATDSLGNTGTSPSVSVSVNNGMGTSVGVPSILPMPYPAPALPAAGGGYVDPTFGTTIIRVTDPATAPAGARVNAASADSMFNANGTYFYVHHGNDTFLYAADRSTARITNLGPLTRTISGVGNLALDGAAWDPTNPNVLYAIMNGMSNRQLWQFTFPYPGTMTMLHNFDAEIPTGGYPIGRVQVSPDARYIAIAASSQSGRGQDFLDYVAVWDRQRGTSRVLNTQARVGAFLHTIVMDTSGEYFLLETNDYSTTYVWYWPSDTLSTALTGVDNFGGKKVLGFRQAFNDVGGAWAVRDLATPHSWSVLFHPPQKNGMVDWFEANHVSKLRSDGSFVASYYVASFAWGPFTVHSGAIYKFVGYVAFSPSFAPPEGVRYGGRPLGQVGGVPTAANQWSYDPAADTLYLWLPNNANPNTNPKPAIFDWRPLMEEIVQFTRDASGAWTWRRFAHHRMNWDGTFQTSPRANVDPTGSFVLFQTNWDATLRNPDGSPRTDVFLVTVPPLQ